MKIVDIFCDRRESVTLLYWQGMQKSLCAGFFEIRLFWDHHEGVINVFIQNIQVAKILAISLSEITNCYIYNLIGKCSKAFTKSSLVWYRVDFDNYRDYVDISKLSKELDYVKALPGICAYTGMNYLPAFCSIMFRLPTIDDKNAKICGWSCGFG